MKKKFLIPIIQLLFANAILAVGTVFFLVPMRVVNGGLGGIALVINEAFGLPIDLTTAILAWFLFFLGFLTLGKSFALKTLLATMMYPLFVFLFLRFIGQDIIGFELDEPIHRLLAAIFGGAFVGLGVATAFLAGGSTGGVDVIILLTKKLFDIKTSITSFFVDVVVIVLGMVVFGLLIGLYGIISTVISSLVIELVFVGFSRSYQLDIISKEWQKINDHILYQVKRGSTLVPIRGGFTFEEKYQIQVIIPRAEYFALKQAIAAIDKEAFVVIHQVRTVFGEGFDQLTQTTNG